MKSVHAPPNHEELLVLPNPEGGQWQYSIAHMQFPAFYSLHRPARGYRSVMIFSVFTTKATNTLQKASWPEWGQVQERSILMLWPAGITWNKHAQCWHSYRQSPRSGGFLYSAKCFQRPLHKSAYTGRIDSGCPRCSINPIIWPVVLIFLSYIWMKKEFVNKSYRIVSYRFFFFQNVL